MSEEIKAKVLSQEGQEVVVEVDDEVVEQLGSKVISNISIME